MDDSTKNVVMGIAVGVLKKVLLTAGAAATAHGFTSGISTEAYSGLAIALAAGSWSLWNDYGKAIVVSQLEVLKARSLAAAKKIQDSGLSPITVREIAAQSPTLTEEAVTKIAATMPPEVKVSVVPQQGVK